MNLRLSVLAFAAATALLAQPGPYRSSDPFGRSFGRTESFRSPNRAIDAIQQDLSRIGQRAAWDRWAVKQFSEASDNLERFQLEAARGRFDRGRLDRAIRNLSRLLTAPELHPRDKQRIAAHRDTLSRLRNQRG